MSQVSGYGALVPRGRNDCARCEAFGHTVDQCRGTNPQDPTGLPHAHGGICPHDRGDQNCPRCGNYHYMQRCPQGGRRFGGPPPNIYQRQPVGQGFRAPSVLPDDSASQYGGPARPAWQPFGSQISPSRVPLPPSTVQPSPALLQRLEALERRLEQQNVDQELQSRIDQLETRSQAPSLNPFLSGTGSMRNVSVTVPLLLVTNNNTNNTIPRSGVIDRSLINPSIREIDTNLRAERIVSARAVIVLPISGNTTFTVTFGVSRGDSVPATVNAATVSSMPNQVLGVSGRTEEQIDMLQNAALSPGEIDFWYAILLSVANGVTANPVTCGRVALVLTVQCTHRN